MVETAAMTSRHESENVFFFLLFLYSRGNLSLYVSNGDVKLSLWLHKDRMAKTIFPFHLFVQSKVTLLTNVQKCTVTAQVTEHCGNRLFKSSSPFSNNYYSNK